MATKRPAHKAPAAKASVIDAYRSIRPREVHPHLDPINAATFTADRGVAVTGAANLLGYQNYLAAARAEKARRKGSTPSFERNVLAQAKQAQRDLGRFSSAYLRMTQQMNHTALWTRTLTGMTDTLKKTGPISARHMWTEIVDNKDSKAALASQGFSAEMTAAVTQALSKLDATLLMHAGKVSVETRVAGENAPRRMSIRDARVPSTITELLRRAQFDHVVSAFSNDEPVHLDTVPNGGVTEYEAPDLVAFGAVAARQRMTDHVRKLEDTGLATHAGQDPVSILAGMLIVGLVLGVFGAAALYVCDDPGPADPPDWVCTAGAIMLYLSLIILGALAALFFIDGLVVGFVALVAFAFLLSFAVDHIDRLFPHYTPPAAAPP